MIQIASCATFDSRDIFYHQSMCNAVRVTNNTLKTWMWEAKNQQGVDLTENHLTKLLLRIMKAKVEKVFLNCQIFFEKLMVMLYQYTYFFVRNSIFELSLWLHRGYISDHFYQDKLFFTRVQCKGYFYRCLKLLGMLTYDRGSLPMYNFYWGYPRWLISLSRWKPAGHLARMCARCCNVCQYPHKSYGRVQNYWDTEGWKSFLNRLTDSPWPPPPGPEFLK